MIEVHDFEHTGTDFQIANSPPQAGAYWLGEPQQGIGFYLTTKPCWLHRTMMRLALGLTWIDTGEG